MGRVGARRGPAIASTRSHLRVWRPSARIRSMRLATPSSGPSMSCTYSLELKYRTPLHPSLVLLRSDDRTISRISAWGGVLGKLA